MWLLNLRTFVNHLFKNKLYTIITILGFSISLTFVILLSVYLKNELSVNENQTKKERIYRLINENSDGNAPPVAEMLQSKYPEIESYTRIYTNRSFVKIDDKDGMIKFSSLMVDSTFFDIFDIEIIEGDKSKFLVTKNSIILSKEYARKAFGNKSPIGKQISINDRIPCTVTGVFDNLTKDTHFKKTDGIINFKLIADIWSYPAVLTSYGNCSFGIYFLEKENSNLPSKAPEILKGFKEDYWLYQHDRVKEVIFEPLSEIYFSDVNAKGSRNNSKILLSILLIIVILILVLSIINYMNLTIAQSGARAKDIAIRKLLGSSRLALIKQHIIESIVLILFSFAIAIFLAFVSENTFNNLLQTELNLKSTFGLSTMLITSVFITLIGIISGLIPAIIITKLKAVDVIKGGFRRKSKAVYSRVLIGFQYVVVIVLLITTMVISQQSSFMMNKDLGYNKDNIIKLPNYTENNQRDAIRNEFLKVPGIKNVSFVAGSPIDGGNNNSFIYEEKPVSFQVFIVDSAFFQMTGIEITPTGVAYSKDGIYLNQTAVNELDLDSLPTHFTQQDKTFPVLGIVNDFNFRALNQEIGMLMIHQMDTTRYPWSILIEIDGNNIPQTMKQMEGVYSDFTDGITIDYEFFDQAIASWYEKEKRMSIIIKYFAILSIIISVMGIYAMSVFYNQQKIKEIGVRKVNGATVFEIIRMLNKDFIKWVLIAFVIAVPIAYYAMNKWLETFAYRIDLSWWIFALAGILALIIALTTVSWNTFISARRNPVDSLMHE